MKHNGAIVEMDPKSFKVLMTEKKVIIGGEHIIKECKATINECINCKTAAAEKRKMNIDWNHPAWSKSCTVLQQNIEREKVRTMYAA